MKRLAVFVGGLVLAIAAALVPAQVPAAQPRVALKGYDPVAYFTDGKPARGDPSISYDFDEARYYFASPAHRDLFAADPDRYAPRFGGYCTGSMTRGVKNEGDPEIWIIQDGRLYVFGSGKGDAAGRAIGLRGRERIQANPAAVVEAAQKNWEAVKR